MKQKKEVVSILTEDIKLLLKKTSQYEEFINDGIFCESCHCIIKFDNISAIKPFTSDKNQKKLKFYCFSNECLVEYKMI